MAIMLMSRKALFGIGRDVLEVGQIPSASAEPPGYFQHSIVRMHLAVLKNQGRPHQPGRTDKIAVESAIAPKYAGIARLKCNEVLLGSIKNLFCDVAAVQRVLCQDRIDEHFPRRMVEPASAINRSRTVKHPPSSY